MIIRTPRRRISPRTKRKYKAIKSFLAKVLGTSSSPRNINTNSSIEISVHNLKSKITSIEQELNKVSKHCQDLTCLQKNFVKEAERSKVRLSQTNSKCGHAKTVETKILYKKPGGKFRIRDGSSNIVKIKNYDNSMNPRPTYQNLLKYQHKVPRIRNDESEKHEVHGRQHRAKSKQDLHTPVYSTSSFHSLVTPKYRQYAEPGYSGYISKQRGNEATKISSLECHRKGQVEENDLRHNKKHERRQMKQKQKKREYSNVDQEFIEKIINKQYRPVKMFGRRDSDFSQFSAPVCRDHEFLIREKIQEDSELCSCCFDENRRRRHRYIRQHDVSDMRSICDTRLYSSKKHHRHTYPSRNIEDYHNSAYYDIVPVKEKSSPKSRRKFAEENAIKYQYKEVPPSPRTRRPRLNLKAQNYTEYDDIEGRPPPFRQRLYYGSDSNMSVKDEKPTKYQNVNVQHHAQIATMSSLQNHNFIDEQTNKANNDTTLSTELTETNVDKTDKALGEIKDILQSFLIEIKKDSTHSGKSNNTSKIGERNFNESHESDKLNTTITQNSGNNFNMAQCNVPPFVPTLPSPYCYPVIPICPMNYPQNGYMVPNSSFTCTCAESSKERASTEKENNIIKEKDVINNETQELIKEIYKYVSQNSKSLKTVDLLGNHNCSNSPKNRNNNIERIVFTNRSAGGYSKTSKHDANVGTPHMRCLSKSCEAIGSRINSDTYYSTNASYSDTVLEKLSLHGSQSSTESDVSSVVAERKIHRNKFQKLLNSLRLFKKKKKDIIEEETESETTVVDNSKQNSRSPFKQNVTNYVMHGQEYFHPPPIPEKCYPPRERQCHHNHGLPHQIFPLSCNLCKHHGYNPTYPYDQNIQNYNPISHSPHPEYVPYQVPPQVPLCLKEVEVKTIGTQSQRKMSIFSKFTKKAQPYRLEASQQYTPPSTEKPRFWKSMQEKAKQQQQQQQKHPDPMDFSLKTQKQLAQGDIKLRNAMLKKLFYKRNPFSPQNLIVKTLLGKDKSSFGDPPKMYRPRMFI